MPQTSPRPALAWLVPPWGPGAPLNFCQVGNSGLVIHPCLSLYHPPLGPILSGLRTLPPLSSSRRLLTDLTGGTRGLEASAGLLSHCCSSLRLCVQERAVCVSQWRRWERKTNPSLQNSQCRAAVSRLSNAPCLLHPSSYSSLFISFICLESWLTAAPLQDCLKTSTERTHTGTHVPSGILSLMRIYNVCFR